MWYTFNNSCRVLRPTSRFVYILFLMFYDLLNLLPPIKPLCNLTLYLLKSCRSVSFNNSEADFSVQIGDCKKPINILILSVIQKVTIDIFHGVTFSESLKDMYRTIKCSFLRCCRHSNIFIHFYLIKNIPPLLVKHTQLQFDKIKPINNDSKE